MVNQLEAVPVIGPVVGLPVKIVHKVSVPAGTPMLQCVGCSVAITAWPPARPTACLPVLMCGGSCRDIGVR
jgi:hypothetical protein